MSGVPLAVYDIAELLPKHPEKRYAERDVSDIRTIVIHHSGTLPDPERVSAFAFARHHVRVNGWPGIGYHYVIESIGPVYKTNPNRVISYHARTANPHSIGVALVGNFDETEPGPVQWQAAVALVRVLLAAYRLTPADVVGHRELFSDTACPGRKFSLDDFRRAL